MSRKGRPSGPLVVSMLLLGATVVALLLFVPRSSDAVDEYEFLVGGQTVRVAPSTMEFMNWLAARQVMRGGQGAPDGSLRGIIIERRLGPAIEIPPAGLRAGRIQLDQRGTIVSHQEPATSTCAVVMVPEERDPSLLIVMCEGTCSSAPVPCTLRLDPASLILECDCP